MRETIARGQFRSKDKLNCAQSVLKAYQDVTGMSDEAIETYKNMGGGKAPNKTCGALYTAQLLMEDNPEIDKIEKEFLSTAGSLECREIRKLKKISCHDCVGLSAKLLDQYITGK